jgi:endosialidase-like protein
MVRARSASSQGAFTAPFLATDDIVISGVCRFEKVTRFPPSAEPCEAPSPQPIPKPLCCVSFLTTALVVSALVHNSTGSFNIALGSQAGINLDTGDNNIEIGNEGVGGESGVIRMGTEGTHTATYIAGIKDTPLVHGAAVAVGITADGQLGVRASSVRFKELVKPMDKASEAIFSLQPVTFRYKKDPTALPQFGLVAEEVAKVNPDLVARDVEGKPFTVRYDEINAMLLNEFLKEHQTVQELKKQVAELTAGLQKLSAQLELSKPATQTALK